MVRGRCPVHAVVVAALLFSKEPLACGSVDSARSIRRYSSDPGTSPERLTPRQLLAGEPRARQASDLGEHSGSVTTQGQWECQITASRSMTGWAVAPTRVGSARSRSNLNG